MSFCERQGCPGIDAKGDDEHGLDAVDDKYEPEGLFVGNTIEYQHGLDGKVPRAGTIRRWYDNGKVGHDKRHEGTADAQVSRKVEAEEREVVVQEVAHPDTDREKQVEGQVLYTSQREHALPDTAQRHLYLIIYREVLQQQVEQDEDGDGTDRCDYITHRRKTVEDMVERGARLLEEGAEDTHLHQQDQTGVTHDDECINGALRHHCS